MSNRPRRSWFDPDHPFGAFAFGLVTMPFVLALLCLVAWVMKALGLVDMGAE